jgi:hypothetical protein
MNLRLTIGIVLIAAAIIAAGVARVISERENPKTKLDQYYYLPGLAKVQLGMSEQQVRRLVGGIWTPAGDLGPGERCVIQQLSPRYPRYEFCFRDGRLIWRSAV